MMTNPVKSTMSADDMERFAWIVTACGFFLAVIFIALFGQTP